MTQAPGLRFRGAQRCIGFYKNLQLTLVQPQGENPVPLGRTVHVPLEGQAQLVPVKFQSRLVIGNDDCHVMNTIQLHNKTPHQNLV